MCEKCNGTDYDKDHCEVEKRGCEGCAHCSKKKEGNAINRKLASIQKIKAIEPIEGADRIECVQVLNWNCVAKKGEYQIGELVIYFEIDSLLPDIPAFEFLKGSSWSQKLNKYKISTHKFRNQISQGLVIPANNLGELLEQIKPDDTLILSSWREHLLEGTDLTEILGIEKYEPPVSNGVLGETINHEWYIPKTDEERIQVCAENVLPVYMNSKKSEWYASIKLDGCSCTAGLFEDMFLIGGRNQWYKDDNMYTTTVKKYITEEKLKVYHEKTGKYIAFQGELCGPGIQSNRLGLSEKDWFIFNIWISETGKMDSYKKCDWFEMLRLCNELGLCHVPMIASEEKFDFTTSTDINQIVKNLLDYVDKIKYRKYFEDASPNQIAEGVVFRMNDMTNSFKVVSNKFLLKGGE